MTFIRPNFRHPELSTNDIGQSIKSYEGALSTLCAGCGHDSISAAIIKSCFDLNLEPHKIAKISGIDDLTVAVVLEYKSPPSGAQCTVTAKAADEVTGGLVYSGSTWFRPDYQQSLTTMCPPGNRIW